MTKFEEIKNLALLKADIITNGKIKQREESKDPFDVDSCFESEKDAKRLDKYHFFELQDKYTYGWYIAPETLEEQIFSISKFEQYILEHYKED